MPDLNWLLMGIFIVLCIIGWMVFRIGIWLAKFGGFIEPLMSRINKVLDDWENKRSEERTERVRQRMEEEGL